LYSLDHPTPTLRIIFLFPLKEQSSFISIWDCHLVYRQLHNKGTNRQQREYQLDFRNYHINREHGDALKKGKLEMEQELPTPPNHVLVYAGCTLFSVLCCILRSIICLLDILSFALYYLSCDLSTRHSFFRTLLSVMWFVYSTFVLSHSTICHVILLLDILSFALYYLSCDLFTRHSFFRTLLSAMWFVYSTFFLSHSTICHVTY
jgi:hypothetical protein